MTRLLAAPKGRIAGPYDLFGATRAVFALLKFVARRWANRRAVRDLLDWDDNALRDIGLTRADVRLALGLPMSEDPSARLTDWVLERRTAYELTHREQDCGYRPHLRLASGVSRSTSASSSRR